MTEMQREIAEVVLKATRSKLAVEDLAGKDLVTSAPGSSRTCRRWRPT